MSWSFNTVARSPDALVSELRSGTPQYQYVPAPLLDTMCLAISNMQANTEGACFGCESSGHLDTYGGNAMFRLYQVRLVG